MTKALIKCKDENVTFGGAVVCATLLAFYHAAKGLPDFDPTQPFKLAADLDYNMRRCVPHPVEEDSVGAYVAFADLGSLASDGVNLKTTKFWDLARRIKYEIDSKIQQTMLLAAVPIILDQRINAKIQPSFESSQHPPLADFRCQPLQRGTVPVCHRAFAITAEDTLAHVLELLGL